MKIYSGILYGREEAQSQSGILVTLNRNSIIWIILRQEYTSQSITKAEYIPISEEAKDSV